MASSAAKTVAEYLEELPVERRKVIASVRKMIREHLPKGYIEAMNWGMISYEVPLKRYPQTYNGQPLMYVALAAQKNNYALYLMSVYGDTRQAACCRNSSARPVRRWTWASRACVSRSSRTCRSTRSPRSSRIPPWTT